MDFIRVFFRPQERVMTIDPQTQFTAFAGQRLVATGSLTEAVRAAKQAFEADRDLLPLVFDDSSGDTVGVNLEGTEAEVLARLVPPAGEPDAKRAGRPKLGVIAREVTLLPRHWDWLAQQPEGASAALRKLVEEARRDLSGKDRARRSKAAADRFMRHMAGDLPLFEDAYRALYAGEDERLHQLTAAWPTDIRNHVRQMVERARRDEADSRGADPVLDQA
jgi:hypothetical protein